MGSSDFTLCVDSSGYPRSEEGRGPSGDELRLVADGYRHRQVDPLLDHNYIRQQDRTTDKQIWLPTGRRTHQHTPYILIYIHPFILTDNKI